MRTCHKMTFYRYSTLVKEFNNISTVLRFRYYDSCGIINYKNNFQKIKTTNLSENISSKFITSLKF